MIVNLKQNQILENFFLFYTELNLIFLFKKIINKKKLFCSVLPYSKKLTIPLRFINFLKQKIIIPYFNSCKFENIFLKS